MKKIILLGYMGSGKSTVGELLSKRIKIPFADLDKLIVDRAQLTIPEIFEKYNEIYFRKLEHEIFKEVVNANKEVVLSIGGGTPCYANNHEFLEKEEVASFYLKGSPDELYKRLLPEKDQRPLISDKSPEELREFIAIHLFERSFFYTKATFSIFIDGKSPEEISSEIEALLV